MLFGTPAGAALPYQEVLRNATLVEGLGFEGVLTVFDETPRMYRNLGTPREQSEYPLWYFYESGAYRITVRAKYEHEHFLVQSIQYTGDHGRSIATNTGIHLGDSVRNLTDSHGEAERIVSCPAETAASDNCQTQLHYMSRGVTFYIGRHSTVIGITVYRPRFNQPIEEGAPPVLDEEGTTPESDAPVEAPVPDLVETSGPSSFGVSVTMSNGWVPTGEHSPTQGSFQAAGGAIQLHMETCEECSETLQTRVRALEGNQLPVTQQQADEGWLSEMKAEGCQLSLHQDGRDMLWTIALWREQKGWLLRFRLKGTQRLTQSHIRDLAIALASVQLL